MQPFNDHLNQVTRRHFFGQSAVGLGTAALGSMLGNELRANEQPRSGGLPALPHFAPRAKRAIYLFMAGAPSQIDLLDYKPRLAGLFDQDLPDSVRMGQRLTTMTSSQRRLPIVPSIYKFRQYGPSGAWISELLPHTASVADELSILRSLHTAAINHDPAITYICTGHELPGKASLGSWLSYGLGCETDELPAFVVLTSKWSSGATAQALFSRLWGSGFLPSRHQGVALRSGADPVLFLSNPAGVSAATRRRMLDALAQINQRRLEEVGNPEIQARIAQYEMAFRMQSSVPELTDLAGETQQTLDMYGPNVTEPGTYASHCLLARRMMERGVRFVQIFHRGWDQHGTLPKNLPMQCGDVDQPTGALIKDLKQRGLLDDTLVIWGGEFGRTVYCQGTLTRENYGRDHHPKCFSVWMAGGGIRRGVVYGKTDDFSYNILENPIHIRDLNATILHCLGIDDKQLSYKFQGLDQRLTGVEPSRVIRDIVV